MNQRPTTCPASGPGRWPDPGRPVGPERLVRHPGRGAADGQRGDPVRGVRGQPHADHAAEGDPAVGHRADAQLIEQPEHITAELGDRVRPAGAGEPPCPRSSYRSTRKCRAARNLPVPQFAGGAQRVAQHQHRRARRAVDPPRPPAGPAETRAGQTSKNTVSPSPCSRMSKRKPPAAPGLRGGDQRVPAVGVDAAAPGRPRWPRPRRRSRSGSRPGPAGRGRTPRRPGAALGAAVRAGQRAGPERHDAVAAAGVGRGPAEAAEAGRRGRRAPRGSSGWSNRPSGSACQVSTSASGTGCPRRPAPGRDHDRARRAVGHHVRAVRPRQPDGKERPYGLGRCETSAPPLLLASNGGLAGAAQHDVPAVASAQSGSVGSRSELAISRSRAFGPGSS